ncbi:MAG: hypothetical protein UT33_C0006G0058 [Candidatus Peregrinibacteria bacterium GW2011_GWC2_39_14]|nr:MAG: hypothetical protein UT33_C0006G0058 [Candidatus Peregrinibacteria bacterium GW2011_GWC2_39_14]
MESNLSLTILCLVLSLIPVIIWLGLMFLKDGINKKVMFIIFLGGIATVLPLFALEYLWVTPPEAVEGYKQTMLDFSSQYLTSINFKDWISYFTNDVFGPAMQTILEYGNKFSAINFLRVAEGSGSLIYLLPTYMFFAMLEEVFKQWVLRSADKKYLIVKAINDSVKYSIVAGLGFSFAENILYFKNGWGTDAFISMYIFRIIFTSAGHMAFSGIFGYYYGMSKFALTIKKVENLSGDTETIRKKMVLKGLVIAMVLHGIFNTSVQVSEMFKPALIFAIFLIVSIYIYAYLLLKRKAGDLVLASDISNSESSTMNKRNEETLLELIDTWFREEKYNDVVQVCDRFLQRDPDNNVVKLFRTRALDHIEGNNPSKKILNTILDKPAEVKDESVLNKYKPVKVQKDFQNSEEFKKFQEQEQAKKTEEKTFKLDIR